MTKMIQRGLTSRDTEAMELFADRVHNFNTACGFLAVEMEGKEQPGGTWELELQFASRAYAREFWTDPKYQTRIKPVSNDNLIKELN